MAENLKEKYHGIMAILLSTTMILTLLLIMCQIYVNLENLLDEISESEIPAMVEKSINKDHCYNKKSENEVGAQNELIGRLKNKMEKIRLIFLCVELDDMLEKKLLLKLEGLISS